jgi:hypothetical protein
MRLNKVAKASYDKLRRTAKKETIAVIKKIYSDAHKTEKREYDKKYRENNKLGIKNKRRETYQLNKKIINHKYYIRWTTNIQIKLAKNLRARLNVALKSNYKVGSAVRDLGCSIQHLKLHLELFCDEGMTWENYGEWHIDHIKPLCTFDLTDRVQFLKANNYTNLQPLWAIDNFTKNRN